MLSFSMLPTRSWDRTRAPPLGDDSSLDITNIAMSMQPKKTFSVAKALHSVGRL